MTRLNSKRICIAVALVLALACVAGLAETYKTYSPLDDQSHTVIEETWSHPSGKSGKPIESGSDTYTEPHNIVNGVCLLCGYTAQGFTNAQGVALYKGMPIDEVLKKVIDALPEGADLGVVGVTDEAAEGLMNLANSAAPAADYLAVLPAFPAETVEGTPCHVVTLAYNTADGNTVEENYAFSAADATLVSLS